MKLSLISSIKIAGLLVSLTFSGATPASALTWTVCNRTTDKISVVIAYGRGGAYVSRGWWNLAPCGGCARVATDASVTGAFVRGEIRGSRFVEGNNLFCIRRQAFTMSGSNVSSAVCRRRGGESVRFRMINLNSANHTTNLTGSSPSGGICFD